jgi:hypothetical protein
MFVRKFFPCSSLNIKNILISALALLITFHAFAQSNQNSALAGIGEVEQSRGVGILQSPGLGPRAISKGVRVSEGDRLTTAADSVAILKLNDGTKMTIRPNSEMVFSEYKFKAEASDNSFVLNLLRGGLRAITGLINKDSPNAARIRTATATVGIRGTDFDARICQGGECRVQPTGAAVANTSQAQVQASAKLLRTQGLLYVVNNQGARRLAVEGSPVYPGEVVETGASSQATLIFRDESKVALGALSRFKIDAFVFDIKAPAEGSFLTTLLRGSLRAVTGLVGKANTRNVRFSTSTATIGIRGTELGMVCEGACAGEAPGNSSNALGVFTFVGVIEVTPIVDGQLREIIAGSGLSISTSGILGLTQLPANLNFPASPASVVIPPSLFLQSDVVEGQDGLYVFVRDGHVELTQGDQILHLGAGETGLSNLIGLNRPNFTPQVITLDAVPLPTMRIPVLALTPSRPAVLPLCPRI